MYALGSLAPGRRVDVDLAFQRLIRRGQTKLALTAAKERLKHLREVGLDCGEGLDEHGAGGAVDLADGLDERLAGTDQVITLRDQKFQTFAFLGVLLYRQRIDGT